VRGIGWLVIMCVLAVGCASGPRKRVFPPDARIQQLELIGDSEWQLVLRVHNYSNVPMRFDRIDAALSIDDLPAGQIRITPNIDVAANSVELLELRLTPSADAASALERALQQRLGSRYRLSGTISASEPRGQHAFEFASRLDPVPGLERVLR
jgi:hypothetical protein